MTISTNDDDIPCDKVGEKSPALSSRAEAHTVVVITHGGPFTARVEGTHDAPSDSDSSSDSPDASASPKDDRRGLARRALWLHVCSAGIHCASDAFSGEAVPACSAFGAAAVAGALLLVVGRMCLASGAGLAPTTGPGRAGVGTSGGDRGDEVAGSGAGQGADDGGSASDTSKLVNTESVRIQVV